MENARDLRVAKRGHFLFDGTMESCEQLSDWSVLGLCPSLEFHPPQSLEVDMSVLLNTYGGSSLLVERLIAVMIVN